MKRKTLLLKYSIFLVMICTQGCALLMVRGMEVMKERKDIKERVDVSCSTQTRIEDVWSAALTTAHDLRLSVVTTEFDGKTGLIIANMATLNYIRIHIYVDDSRVTNIGVQARKKKIPSEFSDYDFAFAEKIINAMRKIIEPGSRPGT
jgi:hypothetical protein